MIPNPELDAHQKFFFATGLKAGDAVVNAYNGTEHGTIYISSLGYACVRIQGEPSRIWCRDWQANQPKGNGTP